MTERITMTNNTLNYSVSGTDKFGMTFSEDTGGTGILTFAGNLVPVTNNTYSIGTGSKRIKEIYLSNSSMYLDDNNFVTIKNGSIQFMTRKDPNLLHPLVVTNRSALMKYGITFIQKMDDTASETGYDNDGNSVTLSHGNLTYKVKNFIKLKRSTDDIADYGTFVDPKTGNNVDVGSKNSYLGKTIQDHLDNSDISNKTMAFDVYFKWEQLNIEEVLEFIRQDVSQAINYNKFGSSWDGSNAINFDNPWDHGYEFNSKGEITGQYNPELGEYKSIASSQAHFFGGSSTAISDYSEATLKLTTDTLYIKTKNSNLNSFTLPEFDYSLYENLDTTNYKLRIYKPNDTNTYYERNIQSLTQSSGSPADWTVTTTEPFFIGSDTSTNIVAGTVSQGQTSTTVSQYELIDLGLKKEEHYGGIFDILSSQLANGKSLDTNDDFNTSNQVLLPTTITSLSYMDDYYNGYKFTFFDASNNETEISHTITDYKVYYGGSEDNYAVWPVITVSGTFSANPASGDSFQLNPDVDDYATDYYDATVMADDPFMNFIMNSVGGSHDYTSQTFSAGDTNYFDSNENYFSTTDFSDQIDNAYLDASKHFAYEDDQFFKTYTQMRTNKYGDFTKKALFIGFKDEPTSTPYCKVTIKGSTRATKLLAIGDVGYDIKSTMTYIKKNLKGGQILGDSLVVGIANKNQLSGMNAGGIYCSSLSTDTLILSGDCDIGGNLSVAGTSTLRDNVQITGDLTVDYDEDSTHYLGRAAIGQMAVSDFAGFSHIDHASLTNFALLQNFNGRTILNAASGEYLSMRINNSELVRITDSAHKIMSDLSVSGISTFESAVTVNDNITAQNVITTSDERLKTNIVNFIDQADINKFRPVEFNWKHSQKGKKILGFIAQEVQANNPDMVYEDENGNLGVDYIQFIAVLTKNVQELNKIVKQQQECIEELEKRV